MVNYLSSTTDNHSTAVVLSVLMLLTKTLSVAGRYEFVEDCSCMCLMSDISLETNNKTQYISGNVLNLSKTMIKQHIVL